MLKLVEEKPQSVICVGDMKDGQIGVIVKWPLKSYLGRVVQRNHNRLITLGDTFDKGWGEYYPVKARKEDCQVRLLEKGEMLIVD